MTTKTITCPLCGQEVEHQTENDTHIWACADCPFAGIEYYNGVDVENLKNKLN